MKKRRFAVPHVYILLIGLILLFSLLTYVIPASTYDMQTITIEETGKQREVVDPDTYRTVDATPVTLMQFLTAIPPGPAGDRSDHLLYFHCGRVHVGADGDEGH